MLSDAKVEKAVRGKMKVPEEIPENQLKVMTCSVKIMIDEGGSVLSRTAPAPERGGPDGFYRSRLTCI